MTDHFYMISQDTMDGAVTGGAYLNEGTGAYVYNTSGTCRSVSLYQLYNLDLQDDLYTTNVKEAGDAINNLGYKYIGIACYIPPDLA